MPEDLEAAAARLYAEFFRRTHLCEPSDLADIVVEEVESALAASDVVLFVVNREETALVPVPSRLSPQRSEQLLEATMAGRCFSSTTILTAPARGPQRRRMWVPVIDGTDRTGVLELCVDEPGTAEDTRTLLLVLERYAHAVAQALLSKDQYGDVFELLRRSRPMTLGTELLGAMLPPATFATDGLVITAMLEPAYANGGDAFDYAVNAGCAHMAVLDGMGHGLEAAGASTLALAAIRHSRRLGRGLVETAAAVDAAVNVQFDGSRFVTAVLARLDMVTGRLHWVSAGHPPPLLVRHGRVAKTLELEPTTPLGLRLGTDEVAVGSEDLEPGDSLLFYTDGVTEARQADGEMFGLEGLGAFLHREASAQVSTHETLRRLRRAIMSHHHEALDDDATAMLVDWRRGTEHTLLPQTV
ncbi:MAG: Stage II sporulation protein E [uncultured Nocardioidaceae bacterium]|uniref:Stage II sporulation protein E n=1 Tax=uncultured Nocardioidaceae bacterium TaxID=253824 RepID=A0A6J4KUJ7_9ACTN|nr:MAG: Stage II sporulation protein E [uncultured Nocardioidaceae bacterium]